MKVFFRRILTHQPGRCYLFYENLAIIYMEYVRKSQDQIWSMQRPRSLNLLPPDLYLPQNNPPGYKKRTTHSYVTLGLSGQARTLRV